MQSASKSATARHGTSLISTRFPRASMFSLRISIRKSAPTTTRRCRTPRFWPQRVTEKRPRVMPGRPTCMIPSFGDASTVLTFRHWCCGERATAFVRVLRARVLRSHYRCAIRVDRTRGPLSPSGAARDICRSHLFVRRGDIAMRVYQFTEQPYPDAWKDHGGSLRVNLPNRKCDPTIAADLFHRYYDEWLLADELGFDIMLNEHHQTATCLSSTVIVGLSILARQTKRARLLVLGYPIGHRQDRLRVAEELAT